MWGSQRVLQEAVTAAEGAACLLGTLVRVGPPEVRADEVRPAGHPAHNRKLGGFAVHRHARSQPEWHRLPGSKLTARGR
jgi:hypothetical protein